MFFSQSCNSNRRPDEEGIKTHWRRPINLEIVIPTADLMKKGLRLGRFNFAPHGVHSNRRPDEEGIKTPSHRPSFAGMIIPTADLMKKGLRLRQPVMHRPRSLFQPQT